MEQEALDISDPFDGLFIENKGQTADKVEFYSMGNPSIALRSDGVMFVLKEPIGMMGRTRWSDSLWQEGITTSGPVARREVAIMIRFEGANAVKPVGRDPLPFRSNFLIGKDPTRWQTDVRSYREVVYANLYEGVDLAYRFANQGMKYSFTLSPGANPENIIISYEGAESLTKDPAGGTIIHTAMGDIEDAAVLAYQGDQQVRCSFVPHSDRSRSPSCEDADDSTPLNLDSLVYATYIGGGNQESAESITLDSDGNAYIVGSTSSVDFPATSGAFNESLSGLFNAYIAKLDPTGSSLIYATYLGGTLGDSGFSIAVDSARSVYITGQTNSTDFPVTPGAFDDTLNGTSDAFVAKLDPTGSSLVYATYLGGGSDDTGYSLAVDSAGNASMTGLTYSTDFPVTPGALDDTLDGMIDAYVARLDPTGGSLNYATYLGGNQFELGSSIATDSLGDVYVTGVTVSADFPVTAGAFDDTLDGMMDAFVTKLDLTGGSLVYATYLGGGSYDIAYSVAVDSAGNAYLTGETSSTDFPATPGAFDETLSGSHEAFVAELNSTGSSLVYSTYLGGGEDTALSICLDSAGNTYVTGMTRSVSFPVTSDAFDITLNTDGVAGSWDAFVAKLDPTGSSLIYATYLGGNLSDFGNSIVVDSDGNASVTGTTYSTDFPVTSNAFQRLMNSTLLAGDAFVVRFDLVERVESYTIRLSPGHRLVSFPLQPLNDSISSVLSSISGCYDYARWYDVADTADHWKSFIPGRAYNDLTRLDNVMGFWLNVTVDCDLVIIGVRHVVTTLELREGWNMIGVPSLNTSYTVADFKADMGSADILVEAFDAGASPYYLRRAADSHIMKAGEGYWVYAPNDATWRIYS